MNTGTHAIATKSKSITGPAFAIPLPRRLAIKNITAIRQRTSTRLTALICF